ncbi:MAG TPA: response regulator transcription factor [Kribbella sp.]|uniref:response regulator transcription factor n=1 Tax=Kribbella sp. TaxID=1871183 RepID=UPI002D76DC8C|nr:response regulator transcription factor [Kribbella sp.]HET6293227.1 response regulator transcription factor [Kribbella sp.]
MLSVVVCNPLRVIGEAVASHLGRQLGMRSLGSVSSLEDLLQLAKEEQPDVALVEPHDLGVSAAAIVRVLLDVAPRTRALMVANVDDAAPVLQALRAGAHGWVAATDPLTEVEEAVRAVAGGGMWVSSAVLGSPARSIGESSEDARRLVDGLTERERTVLGCLVGGLDRRALAFRLGIAESTSRTHVQRVLGKLGARTAVQAAVIGRRAGVQAVTPRR